MPLIEHATYRAKGIFKNGHVNTIYPYLFRKSFSPTYDRQRVHTPDLDFFDLDVLENPTYKKCTILIHGLEGSSASQYMQATAQYFYKNQFNTYSINHRSCSGEPNLLPTSYHSGAYQDLDFLLSILETKYKEIHIVGFSLGGNILLKYLGDGQHKISNNIHSAMAVSVPIDLHGCIVKISSGVNRMYEQNFLKSLLKKAALKKQANYEAFEHINLNQIKTLYDFDDQLTGPLHGFKNALHYYQSCSSLQFLKNIKIPTLLLNAQDDPFLSKESFPFRLAQEHQQVYFCAPKHGGHCGFFTKGKSYYWIEKQLVQFAKNRCL